VLEAPIALKSVLVVEDKRIHRETLERLLAGDYTVTVAADRETAESRLHGASFDLLILDSKIPPGEAGETSVDESWSFLRTFREQSTAPVIMVVSHPITEPFRNKAEKFNVAAILEKPFQLAELNCAVKKVLAGGPCSSAR
jgi:CheY-like chemotaxis protein